MPRRPWLGRVLIGEVSIHTCLFGSTPLEREIGETRWCRDPYEETARRMRLGRLGSAVRR